MESIIWLKNGGVKYFTLPENCESYKLLKKAHEYRDRKEWSFNDGEMYICLTLKAIMKAPKGTKFWYDFNEKRYTKRQAIDYILDYEHIIDI